MTFSHRLGEGRETDTPGFRYDHIWSLALFLSFCHSLGVFQIPANMIINFTKALEVNTSREPDWKPDDMWDLSLVCPPHTHTHFSIFYVSVELKIHQSADTFQQHTSKHCETVGLDDVAGASQTETSRELKKLKHPAVTVWVTSAGGLHWVTCAGCVCVTETDGTDEANTCEMQSILITRVKFEWWNAAYKLITWHKVVCMGGIVFGILVCIYSFLRLSGSNFKFVMSWTNTPY